MRLLCEPTQAGVMFTHNTFRHAGPTCSFLPSRRSANAIRHVALIKRVELVLMKQWIRAWQITYKYPLSLILLFPSLSLFYVKVKFHYVLLMSGLQFDVCVCVCVCVSSLFSPPLFASLFPFAYTLTLTHSVSQISWHATSLYNLALCCQAQSTQVQYWNKQWHVC